MPENLIAGETSELSGLHNLKLCPVEVQGKMNALETPTPKSSIIWSPSSILIQEKP
jgi:hypothetical protein